MTRNPTPAAISDATSRFLASTRRMLIGGEWHDALSGERIDVTDPATGGVIATVPSAMDADVDRAVRAARVAFESPAWRSARPVDRERWLLRLADAVELHAQELAEIETLDNGKPLAMSLRVDVPSAVDFLARFIRHVLPKGYVKIRHYGLLAASNVHTLLEQARALVSATVARTSPLSATTFIELLLALTGRDIRKCVRCEAAVTMLPLPRPDIAPIARAPP
jgi:acyl-CoA reductase-like NAD-dependent aldehyde dehydrogenase